MGSVVYSSSFHEGDGWYTGTVNANTKVSLSHGNYVVHASTHLHHVFFTPYSTPHAVMSVEAAATAYPSDNISMGPGCQSDAGVNPPVVYQLAVYPDGQWYIEEARLPGGVQPLTSGTTAPLGSSATLQLTCAINDRTSSTETTELIAYVNGTKVGATASRINQTSITGFVPVLVVGSYGPQVSVTFTHVTVRAAASH
jgi:hypothetical protein